MSEFLIVPTSHGFLRLDSREAGEVVNFLKRGRFGRIDCEAVGSAK